jgi:16S rRNA (adenine1518-N6/adenine1519-N6)-dimethyltransferase
MPRGQRPKASDRTPRARRPPGPLLRKSLGQHHLRSGATCRPLLDFLRPEGRLVVEIGPGGGVLTRELLDAGARVVAVELDPAWSEELRRRIDSPRLEIHVGDALELDWAGFPDGTLVAGNLPYNVGTAIVERLLRVRPAIERAGFLLQREVVDRIVAGAGDEAYGALSVLVALRAAARRLGIVRPGAFVPPPKVDSAFVGFTPVALPGALSPDRAEAFETWIRVAFGQRRKTLANALAGLHPRAAVVAALAGIARDATVRAEALALPELVQLFAVLEGAPGAMPREAGGTISRQGKHEET